MTFTVHFCHFYIKVYLAFVLFWWSKLKETFKKCNLKMSESLPSPPPLSLCVCVSLSYPLSTHFLFCLVLYSSVCRRIDTRWALVFSMCFIVSVNNKWRQSRASSRRLRHIFYPDQGLACTQMPCPSIFYSLLSWKSQVSRTGLCNVCRTMLYVCVCVCIIVCNS